MLRQSEDRRIRRSRKLLKQGLLELMQEKPFSAISVREITERMDMNRGTFYLHYPDTTALLKSLENDLLREAQSMIDKYLPKTASGTLQPVFEPILDYIVENRDLCSVLFINNSSSNFVDRLHEMIFRNSLSPIKNRLPKATDAQIEYLLSFITYGLIGLIKEWFDTDMKLMKDQLVRVADNLVNGAIDRVAVR